MYFPIPAQGLHPSSRPLGVALHGWFYRGHMHSDGTDHHSPAEAGIDLRDNEAEDQFELHVNGTPAGLLTYTIEGANYALHHEEIDEHFQGRGIGAQMVSRALDQIRSSGHGVLPYCPFVLSYLKSHPEYQDLVPAGRRADFDLPG